MISLSPVKRLITVGTLFSVVGLSLFIGGKLYAATLTSYASPAELLEFGSAASHNTHSSRAATSSDATEQSTHSAAEGGEGNDKQRVVNDSLAQSAESVTPLPRVLAPIMTTSLYVRPDGPASLQSAAWQGVRPDDAERMQEIADQPIGIWLVGAISNIDAYVSEIMDAAEALDQAPVFVLYNIPRIGCGSAGASTADAYRSWVDEISGAVGRRRAIVVVEPDALALFDCLSLEDQVERLELIDYVVKSLRSHTDSHVYVDAGNAFWIPKVTMSERLDAAGIALAHGFALNVSNYLSDADNIAYGTQLAALVGDKHFVIDTSRNGNGPTEDYEWCNAPGRALGKRPTLNTDHPLVDGYLWIKYPGESDGTCNGGPPEGQWWPEYVLGLAEQAEL